MNHLIEDGVKVGYSLKSVLIASTDKGRLLEMVRANRPNWSYQSCSKAVEYLLGIGLKSRSDFDTASDYLSYLDKQLTRFTDKNPLSPRHEVADSLMLRQWENRWHRARTCNRAAPIKTVNTRNVISEKVAA